MARVESLGLHNPVALPYLIREGILPHEPKQDLYQWQTYVSSDGNDHIEEEVLTTRTAVAWSQGKFIRNIYRFDLEGEDVVHALLTTFAKASSTTNTADHGPSGVTNGYGAIKPGSRSSLGAGHQKPRADMASDEKGSDRSSERALVVVLKTKIHIHFVHGARHIVDLPFEVAVVFPAPRGLILQRKASPLLWSPPTPQMPPVPQNSFLSSQLYPNSSYLQSPTLAKSFVRTQPIKPSPLGVADGRLEALYQDLIRSSTMMQEEGDALLYSLTGPFSDLGVVTVPVQQQRPRLSARGQANFSVELESLDPGEEIVYVSPGDEIQERSARDQASLMLIVTVNKDLQMLTVWHAWYIEERTLSSMTKQRADAKAAKARRRSSFLSGSMGTGATTPMVRQREPTRDSFAGAGAMRLPGDPGASQSMVLSRQPTRKEEEEAMASQMDPDYPRLASQQPVRESRRISSMNAEIRLAQNATNASFVATGNRRHTSFGGPNERRSIGHRKSRASTPGSVFSRSIGPDDDSMDVDSGFSLDGEEKIEETLKQMRATIEAAGTDNVFGSADDEFKRELACRKLHSMSMSSAARVVTLKQTEPIADIEDSRLNVYIHDQVTRQLICLQIAAKRRQLFPDITSSNQVAVPVIIGDHAIGFCTDVIKLKDGRVEAILLAGRGLLLSTEDYMPLPLPTPAPYRVYDPLDLTLQRIVIDKDIGKNRTLHKPNSPVSLSQGGARGNFDEVTKDGAHHHRRLQIRPHDTQIDALLQVCQIVLPKQRAALVRKIWCAAYSWLLQHPGSLTSTASSAEWVAFAATVLANAIHLLDAKARAALQLSRLAGGKPRPSVGTSAQASKQRHESQLFSQSSWSWIDGQRPNSSLMLSISPKTRTPIDRRKDQLMIIASALADELATSLAPLNGLPPDYSPLKLMLGLHIQREEQKLSILSSKCNTAVDLAPLIAQLGNWLGLDAWSYESSQHYKHEGGSPEQWAYVKSVAERSPQVDIMEEPVGLFQWLEHTLKQRPTEQYPTLANISALASGNVFTKAFEDVATSSTPRLVALSSVLNDTDGLSTSPAHIVEAMSKHNITADMLETFPGAVAAPFRDAIARCEREPPTTWSNNLLQLVGREDLDLESRNYAHPLASPFITALLSSRDVQTVCGALEQHPHTGKTKEASRHAVSLLIFSEDRRLVEAFALMHFNGVQIAECPKQPDWSDAQHFEHQRRAMQFVTLRMIALPAGDGMIHFDSQTPLLTEKFLLPGFNSSCLMQPMGHTLTTDRTGLTEEKVNWAYFHAGVSAGLRISRNVKGIDTSWVAFNKPPELTNRYAGLLLALGLSGHLYSLAKWLSFKYLTPKHNMTSVGLLLGLSASYMGTMDSLITRMLSVHITRMLPAGAAELNVSPVTQTAGLMGIGMLYYSTQHRRMSEIMLSEIEFLEVEDPDGGPDELRDESYRLAAGFALGFINLAQGQHLKGLHGMQLPERLLAIAVGPRPVGAVHVFDRATAGAIVAIALVYMKTGNKSVARKIDIPDTEAQFDHVRPDMLVLRAMAKHLILWDSIKVSAPRSDSREPDWIKDNLPPCYKNRFREICSQPGRYTLKTSDVPFYNIATGLAWALSLKYAGSGNEQARDEILAVLDAFYAVKGGEVYYYDAKLARATIRRCIDVLALSAATIMGGTGDLKTLRYLRRLHGRTDAETSYGSHMAAHLAIGVLFLAGGTYTLGTSDLAIASLICAFYPLFPTDVHDNRVHLQAFRHFWVFAAEARCLVIENIDNRHPIRMPIIVTLRDGPSTPLSLQAPCLLPDLATIATVQTVDPAYWRVTLDFRSNPAHLAAFRRNQGKIFVRRCPASEAHTSTFSAMLAALNDTQLSSAREAQVWHSIIVNLPAFKEFDKADMELLLPPDVRSAVHMDERGTVVDERLGLTKAAAGRGGGRDALWGLRLLLGWAEQRGREGGGGLRWIGEEVVEGLRTRIEGKRRRIVKG